MRTLRPGRRHSRDRYNNFLLRRARRKVYNRRKVLAYAFSDLPRSFVFEVGKPPGWIKNYVRRTQ